MNTHISNLETAERTSAIGLSRAEIDAESVAAAAETLRSGWIGYGPASRELERVVSGDRDVWSLATQSCTAALWIAARLLHEGPDDEIVMPATTFAASLTSFAVAGWNVTLCDVDPKTGLIDLEDAKAKIGPRTRALLVVDVFGQPAPVREARALADAHGLALVRDAAHRIDCDSPEALLPDLSCYSFGPTKEIASPDGGLICSPRRDLEDAARALSWWGASQDTWDRARNTRHGDVSFDSPYGLKLRMTDVSAAMVLAQFHRREAFLQARQEMCAVYTAKADPAKVRFSIRTGPDSCCFAFGLVAPDRRDALRQHLQLHGIATSNHYPSLTRFQDGAWGTCPKAEAFGRSVVTFPLHRKLGPEDIAHVCQVIGTAP